MPTHDIVVIGASAGGVEGLSRVAASLPKDLRAVVLVVLHVGRGKSLLPQILTRAGRLQARTPNDGERLRYGQIYVAAPDHHMIVDGSVVRMTHGPTENGVRPAIDPLFRSAARSFGSRVIGVVLTGSLDDGTAGLLAVKQAGGVAIVQDPDDAFAPSMPRSALNVVAVDHVLRIGEVGPMIEAVVREQAARRTRPEGPAVESIETDRGNEILAVHADDRPGTVSVFTCPECSGSLWETEESGVLRFRCRVGHVYSPESMVAEQTDAVDRALWTALRALEERAALNRKLAQRAKHRQHTWVASAFEARALATEEQAALVKQVLLDRSAAHISPDPVPDGPDPSPELRTAETQS